MLRRKIIFQSLFGFALLGAIFLGGCGSAPYDVELAAPDQTLDIVNPALPVLANALPKNPRANTFRLSYAIVPDATKRLEAIPHFLIYNRKAKTLEIHRDRATYEIYNGVSDAILTRIAAQKGGTIELGAACKSVSQPEK